MDSSLELVEELECPVCLEYFQPPIAICKNGHSVCGKCVTQITRCPVCRAAILNTTNRTLEKIMRKLKVRCEFSSFGCNVASFVQEIRRHEMVCTRRPYRCPITGCAWMVPLSAMKGHLQAKHEIQVNTQDGQHITSLGDFGKNSHWLTAVLFRSEIFLQVSKIKGDKLYSCVVHIGPENISSKFRYTVQIYGAGGNGSVSENHVVRNYVCGFDRIMRPGNCASFMKNFALRYLIRRSVLKIKVTMHAT